MDPRHTLQWQGLQTYAPETKKYKDQPSSYYDDDDDVSEIDEDQDGGRWDDDITDIRNDYRGDDRLLG